ncbi:phage protein D [Pseudomonas sp. AS2.8]|nr:phage protein D [Pseudomonas sp. AS2.8]
MDELALNPAGCKGRDRRHYLARGNVQHSLTADGGYTTRLELEAKLPEDLVDEIQGDYTGIIAYYRDPKTGKEHPLTEGDQSKSRRLRHLYATKATAKREWKRLQETQQRPSTHADNL